MRVDNYLSTKLLPLYIFFLSLHQICNIMEIYTIYLLTKSKTLPRIPIRSFLSYSAAIAHLQSRHRRYKLRYYAIYKTEL